MHQPQTVQAVCEAQRYSNLPETGAADRALMACLAGNAPTEDTPVGEQSVETIAQEGVELCLTGYRYAAPNERRKPGMDLHRRSGKPLRDKRRFCR